MNTSKYTAKNTQKLPRIAVAWPVWGEIGHLGYQIEAEEISDSKSSLDLP